MLSKSLTLKMHNSSAWGLGQQKGEAHLRSSERWILQVSWEGAPLVQG